MFFFAVFDIIVMFSSKERLAKRTPRNGIDRREFICLLVDEYYETTNVEAQEQVTANLANFAYDPLNYEYLRESKALELFIQLLSSPNPNLVLHVIAGICNLCLEPESHRIIVDEGGIEAIASLLDNSSPKIVENSIATLLQLDSAETHAAIFSVANRSKVATYQKSPNIPLRNLATVFLETARNASLPSNRPESTT